MVFLAELEKNPQSSHGSTRDPQVTMAILSRESESEGGDKIWSQTLLKIHSIKTSMVWHKNRNSGQCNRTEDSEV